MWDRGYGKLKQGVIHTVATRMVVRCEEVSKFGLSKRRTANQLKKVKKVKEVESACAKTLVLGTRQSEILATFSVMGLAMLVRKGC